MNSLRLLIRSTDNYDAKIEGATVNVGSTPYIYNKVRTKLFTRSIPNLLIFAKELFRIF